jgi:lysophospholipase L1-like esterase
MNSSHLAISSKIPITPLPMSCTSRPPHFLLIVCAALISSLAAAPIDDLAGKKVLFLGDSITQAGGYVTFTDYFLEKLLPGKSFDIYGLGLSSETLAGLTEKKHPFPRPCLFERLARVLDSVKPDIVFACYGMNDGIYQPLDPERFAAFRNGVTKLINQCKAAGVQQIYIITPPIFDSNTPAGVFNYESVLAEYAAWEKTLSIPGVTVIDLHSAMKAARSTRTTVFSQDHVHPGDEGHLLMARTILTALGVVTPEVTVQIIKADPLYSLVNQKRTLRSNRWLNHTGYTRDKTVLPQPLGTTETDIANLQTKIDTLRRNPSSATAPSVTNSLPPDAKGPLQLEPAKASADSKGASN